MAQDRVSRPVSGEILAGDVNRSGNEPLSERDIVEAEYETVVGRHEKLNRAVDSSSDNESSLFGLNILNNRDKPEPGGRASPAFWIAGAVLVGAAFWISGGHSLVSHSDFQLASAPAPSLTIQDVKSRIERHRSKPYLMVEGVVVNDGGQRVALPDLIIKVTAIDGLVTRYRIAGGNEQITSGGKYAFSSRLGAPQSGVDNVKVTIRDNN